MKQIRNFIEKKFRESKGIIAPIRAIDVFFTDENDFEQGMNTMAEIQQKLYDGDKESFYKRFKGTSKPVGYFAACLDGDKVRFGYSLCNPKDVFDKNYGICSAMTCEQVLAGIGNPTNNTTRNEIFNIEQLHNRTVQVFDVGEYECDCVYDRVFRYWPISLRDQFVHFYKRCVRYYGFLNEGTKKAEAKTEVKSEKKATDCENRRASGDGTIKITVVAG